MQLRGKLGALSVDHQTMRAKGSRTTVNDLVHVAARQDAMLRSKEAIREAPVVIGLSSIIPMSTQLTTKRPHCDPYDRVIRTQQTGNWRPRQSSRPAGHRLQSALRDFHIARESNGLGASACRGNRNACMPAG